MRQHELKMKVGRKLKRAAGAQLGQHPPRFVVAAQDDRGIRIDGLCVRCVCAPGAFGQTGLLLDNRDGEPLLEQADCGTEAGGASSENQYAAFIHGAKGKGD